MSSSTTPSPVLDLSNSDLFLPEKDTSRPTKSSPVHSIEQEMEIREEMEVKEEEELGEELLRGSDEVDDGFRTPEKKMPMERNCPPAPVKPKPPAPFLTRKRKSSNVRFLFRFDLAKEIQESLLQQVHQDPNISRIIKKLKTV